MPGLKNATLNAGSGNTQYDAYSREDFEYDLAGNPYRYKSGTANWNTVSLSKNNQTTQINYASDAVLPIRGKAPADATLNISVDGALQNYTRPTDQEEFAFGLNAYTSTRKYHEVNAEAVETDNNTTPPTTIRTMQRGNPNAPTRGQFNIHLRQSYEKAKERRKTMCLDKTACCPDVTIEIKWIGGNYGENDLVYKTYLYFTPKIDTEKCIR